MNPVNRRKRERQDEKKEKERTKQKQMTITELMSGGGGWEGREAIELNWIETQILKIDQNQFSLPGWNYHSSFFCYFLFPLIFN